MWIWLILKNISLLDRIWRLWLAHLPTNFIFWLGRLIFSVSINSHPDNIYFSCDQVCDQVCEFCTSSLALATIPDLTLRFLWLWCIRIIRIWIWIHWFCWFGNGLLFRWLITLTEKGILFNFFSFSNHVSVHDHVTNKKNQNYRLNYLM